MTQTSRQLELLGLSETIRQATVGVHSPGHRTRAIAKVTTTHEIMARLPGMEDLSFLHSGLAQTCFPHSRPDLDSAPWKRSAGKFSLIVTPGVVGDDSPEGVRYVGVPYGPKARLILIYLQTEGVKSRIVSLGPNLSSFLRSLGLTATGGKNGSITSVREQCLRIARCQFTMQWSDHGAKGRRDVIQDTRIVDGLELWTSRSGKEWSGTVELSARFQEHLKEHAVPLDKRALSKLADNSLGLDLYALFAYRLPQLDRPLHLAWSQLQSQIGTSYLRSRDLHGKVAKVMPDVLSAYPCAKVEVIPTGIMLHPSGPAVPRTLVSGFRLVAPA